MPPRPKALESDLEDRSPIAPAPAKKAAPVPPQVEEGGRVKMGFYTGQSGRIRAAYLHTRGNERQETFGEFMENAVLEKIARLEKQYNDGQPWHDVDAGTIKSITQIGVGRNRPR
ncbi:MAG: hypothetical protein WAW17_16090 [Rhodococcus sp. (in: high G+C Gram-positive bacteria)]|uniref:ParB family protein n=1 Tax=Rhodococcus sp. TaxID=1831 RepID=UPI003BAF1E41